MDTWLRRALWERVPRDHREHPEQLRRRQLVAAVGLVAGAVVLRISLGLEPGSPWFYAGSLGLSALWAGAAFASGELHLGRITTAAVDTSKDDGGVPVIAILAAILALVAIAAAAVVARRRRHDDQFGGDDPPDAA